MSKYSKGIVFPATITEMERRRSESGHPHMKCKLSIGHFVYLTRMDATILSIRHPLLSFVADSLEELDKLIEFAVTMKIVILWEQRLVRHESQVYTHFRPARDQGVGVNLDAPVRVWP